MIKYYLQGDKGQVKGFIAVNIKNNRPHLQHMFLNDKDRNIDNVRHLIKKFVAIIKKIGATEAYIHACTKRQAKLIEYYFKTEPYAVKDAVAWYLIKTDRGGQ